MPSESALHLFERSQEIAAELYRITVTDPWYQKGGNIEVASVESQTHSMSSVLAGIKGIGPRDAGVSVTALGGRAITQSRDSWILQGRRTLASGKGICTDCAAAAAVEFLTLVESTDFEAKVEIISSTTHAFVVVNRNGDVRTPVAWGDDAFVLDVWYQNQFPKDAVKGAFWANSHDHPVATFIRQNAYRLRVDVTFREVIGSLFD
jgi:hypothetical protein